MYKKKFVVIVLYNCLLGDSDSFKSITDSLKSANEIGVLFVYDNSAKCQQISVEDKVWENIIYVHNPLNPGLGVAYNSASKVAIYNNFDWMLLMDQDTSFDNNMICELNSALKQYQVKLFAPILRLSSGKAFSPVLYKNKRGYPKEYLPGKYCLKDTSPVNSGMYINIKAFEEVGGYNPKIKLDFADFQFIEKFEKINKQFVLINSIGCQDFSNNEFNIEKSFNRFKQYIDGALNCEKESFYSKVQFFYSVFRHSLSLTLRFKNIIFIKFFTTNYLKINI